MEMVVVYGNRIITLRGAAPFTEQGNISAKIRPAHCAGQRNQFRVRILCAYLG